MMSSVITKSSQKKDKRQVNLLYIVQLPNEEGDMYIIQHLVHHDMPCDPNLVSAAFYTVPIFPF